MAVSGICCYSRQRFELAERAEDDHRLAVLVFGRGFDLVAGQFERDPLAGFAGLRKMQRVPVDRDLAAADAEEAAEIDDGGAHLAGAVDQHIDDPAHILVGGAAHLAAENAFDLMFVEDGHFRGGRRRRIAAGGVAGIRRRGGSALSASFSRKCDAHGDGQRQQCGRRQRRSGNPVHAASSNVSPH